MMTVAELKAMSRTDAMSLCEAADEAWKRASGRTRKVKFTWRRQRFYSTLTTFRTLVYTPSGVLVAGKYHS
jgi:hypothetical protein